MQRPATLRHKNNKRRQHNFKCPELNVKGSNNKEVKEMINYL
jgi:hypothetical protein